MSFLPAHGLLSRLITHIFVCFQIAVPDLLDSAKDADIYIFVIPHQFLPKVCQQLVGKVKSTAIGVSLIKVSCLIHELYCVLKQLLNKVVLTSFLAVCLLFESLLLTVCVVSLTFILLKQ